MAKQPIAIIASDTHCVPHAWVGRPGLAGDAYHAFKQVVSAAIKQKLPLILAGDIIDMQDPPAETAQFLRKQFDRMEREKLDVLYVLGNHEITEPSWLAAVHDWPRCLHRSTVQLAGYQLTGLNFTPYEQLQAELDHVKPGTDILVCHQAWVELMGTLCRTDGSLAQVPYARLTITGDYHKFEQLKILNANGKPMRVLSPGSTVQTEITETEPRLYHILYDDLSIKSVDIVHRVQIEPPVLQVEVDLQRFMSDVDSQIAEAVKEGEQLRLPEQLLKPIIRVTYNVTIPNVYQRLKNAIGDKAHFFRKEIRPEPPEKAAKQKKLRDAVKAGLIGCLSEVVPDVDGPLYKNTRALLEAAQRGEKPELTLQRLRQEFLDGGASQPT